MKWHSLFFIIIISSLLSCRPIRDINFEYLSPATIELPDAKSSYLVLNCSYLPEYVNDPSNLITGISYSLMPEIDSIITVSIFDGLFSVLDDSPNESLRNAGYLEIRTSDTTGFLHSISPATVAEICGDNKVEYLISFEYYSFNQTIEHFYDSEGIDYTLISHIQKLLWRIYDHSGKIMDEHSLNDTLFSDELKADYYDPRNELFYNKSLIKNAFLEAGMMYGERISPSWKKAYRFLYELKENTRSGRVEITNDPEKLMKLCSSANKTKAYTACFNLAVLSELKNDINDAIKWIEMAKHYKQTIPLLQYSSILKDRLNESKTLDHQINKVN